MEEIIVTASKRPRNSQDLGMAIAVFDAESLKQRQVRDLPEAAALIANVELFEDFSGGGVPAWVIRGVGLQDFNTNNTTAAAVYLDQVYQPSVIMGGSGLYDVERLEVLKGPQGGLYGRNTSGGAVLLSTRRARLDEREGYLSAELGRWRRAEIEAGVSVPLADTLALRLAGRVQHGAEGWQQSLPAQQDHGEVQRWDLRSWLLWQPHADFKLEWKLQGGEDRSDIALGLALGLYGRDGRLCEAILAGQRDQEGCLSFAGFNRLVTGQTAADLRQQSRGGKRSLSDPLNRLDNDYWGQLLQTSWQINDLELLSLTAWDRFNYGVSLDLDASPGRFAHRRQGSKLELLSQEFRVVSTAEGAFSWLAGVVFSRERFVEDRYFGFADNFLVSRLIGAGEGILRYDQDTDAVALYADLAYELSPQWQLNLSLRHTEEDKRYRNGELFVPGSSPVYLARDISRDYRLGSPWSGRVALEWRPAPDWLSYLSLSNGFKSGGFYGGFPVNSPEEVSVFEEERIVAWELGLKREWPEQGLRLNAALFDYDYRDVQSYVTRDSVVTGTAIDVLANPADAKHHGGELQVEWMPTSVWRLVADIAYLDAHFVDGEPSKNLLNDLVPIDGRRPYAPRWSGSLALQHSYLLSSGWALETTLDYNYRSRFNGTAASVPERALNDLPGYGLWNARLAVSPADQSLEVALWARNLLNERYRSHVKNDGLRGWMELYGEPRSLGLSLRLFW